MRTAVRLLLLACAVPPALLVVALVGLEQWLVKEEDRDDAG